MNALNQCLPALSKLSQHRPHCFCPDCKRWGEINRTMVELTEKLLSAGHSKNWEEAEKLANEMDGLRQERDRIEYS